MEEIPLPPDPGPQGWQIQPGRLPPELRDYYLRQLNEEEINRIIADVKELRETGGLELKDFIHELEEIVNACEPPQ